MKRYVPENLLFASTVKILGHKRNMRNTLKPVELVRNLASFAIRILCSKTLISIAADANVAGRKGQRSLKTR
jgi:hypothetical protein